MLRYMLLAALVAAALGAPLAARAEDRPVPLLKVGDTAPAFTLPTYNAKEAGAAVMALANLVGDDAEDAAVKTVLVSFMASWCEPCKKELPFLQRLLEKNRARGLRILIVSIDKEPEGQAKVLELIAANKLTVPVLKDRFNFVARRWLGDKSPLPSVFLVDRAGKVSMASYGYSDDATKFLEGKVEAVLGGSAPVSDAK